MARLILILGCVAFNCFAIRNGVMKSHIHHPYVVKLEMNNSICSGVRISEDYIVTAAHCFRDNPRRFTVRYINHEGYRYYTKLYMNSVKIKSTKLEEELAVIKLNAGAFVKYPEIKTVQRGDFNSESLFEILGFGFNERGQEGKLRQGELNYALEFFRGADKYTMLQMKPTKDDQLPCPGDSGGPLFINEEGDRKLVGIVSYITDLDDRIDVNDDVTDQCKFADRATYIPLSEHMDFLKDYL